MVSTRLSGFIVRLTGRRGIQIYYLNKSSIITLRKYSTTRDGYSWDLVDTDIDNDTDTLVDTTHLDLVQKINT